MATLSQITPARPTAAPLVLWHLLSLDAPSVAALWTWYVARISGISLPAGSLLALFLAVWILYAADRLLDTRALSRPMPWEHRGTLEARHLFHHRNARLFLSCMAAAALLLLWLVPRMDPATLRLYGLEGAVLVLWFLILHATRSAHRLPKECAVGLFFAAAIFIPTVARAPQLQPRLLPGAILFAVLCGLNCLYIYRWEHESDRLRTRPHGRVSATGASQATHPSGCPVRGRPLVTDGGAADQLGDPQQPPHPTTRLGLRLLHPVTALAFASGLALALLDPAALRPLGFTCAASVAALWLLDRQRTRLQPVTLRAAADLVLMFPLLYLPFLQSP